MFITKLHTSVSKSALAILTMASTLILSSCQDEDFGYTADQIAYNTNFEKAYGKISEIPTWDLSTYNLNRMKLQGGPSEDYAAIGGAQTRAMGMPASDVISDYRTDPFNVAPSTTTWLNAELAEKVNNSLKGEAFTMINPYYDNNPDHEDNRDFLIIPIYQGASGMTWDLHIVDEQHDYNIWSKSKGIQYTYHFDQWEEYSYPDLVSSAITFREAYKSNCIGSSSTVWVSFEMPTGSLSGRFYLKDSNQKIAYVSDVAVGTLSSGRGIEANKINLTPILGKSYSSSDGTQVRAANDLSNLYFEPSEISGVVVDPYPAERLHLYVKVDNPQISSEVRPLVNFEKNGYGYLYYETDFSNVSYFKGHTIERKDVQSNIMKVNTKNLGREFSLYLQTTYSDKYNQNYSMEGVKHRSDGNPHMMLALTAFSGGNSPIDFAQTLVDLGIIYNTGQAAGYEYLVVGCEDANGSLSDWDYNDVVLLFVGMPKVPKVAKNVIKKRYMIEDLGSTFDFDFNDIVVDVTEEDIQTIGTNEDPVRKQTVSISHLCGTIPFEVFIGGQSVFGHAFAGNNTDSHGLESGYDPTTAENYESYYVKTFDETSGLPWDPINNNITIYVWPKNAGISYNDGHIPTGGHGSLGSMNGETFNNLLDIKDAQQINFPKQGEFPYIIAVDQDINWMKEHHSVPRSWFYSTPSDDIINDYNTNTNIPIVTPDKITDADFVDADFENLPGTLVPASCITDNSDGTTTIDVGKMLRNAENKPLYRDGKITLTIALNGNCSAQYTEVKGTFVSDRGALPNANVILRDFTTESAGGKVFIVKSVDLTSDEAMNAAYANDLKFVVSYATYGFKGVNSGDTASNNPRARVLVSHEDTNIHSYKIGTTTSAPVSEVFLGAEVSRYNIKAIYTDLNNVSGSSNGIEKDNNNNQVIRFGKYFGSNYTADQKAYVTFVVPAGGKISGSFNDYDTDWFMSDGNSSFDNTNGTEPRAFTIELSGAYRRALETGNGKNEFRFVVASETGCTANPTNTETPQVQIYVNWDQYGDANKKQFTITNTPNDLKLVVTVDGSAYSIGSAKEVLPGSTVKVSAKRSETADDQYRITWLNNHNEIVATSLANETVVFTVNENTELNCVVYYLVQDRILRQISSGSDAKDYTPDSEAGYSEFTWNGQTSRGEIYVPLNATVKMTAVANNGYTFQYWWGYTALSGDNSSAELTVREARAYYPNARFSKQTTNNLSVSCTDTDFEFVFTIDGVESPIVNSVNVTPGSNVKVSVRKKAESSLNINADSYRVQWNVVGATPNSSDYKSATLTMPSADVSINATLLYRQVPVVQIWNGNEYTEPGYITNSIIPSIGSITLTYNGQSVTNDAIYLPLGASYKATVSAAAGYTFKEWRYRGSNSIEIDLQKAVKNVEYGPHAVFEEKKITVTAVVSPSEAGSVTLTNNKNQESGTNTLSVQAGNVDFTATPNANDGYRFYTWGWGNYDNPRGFQWNGQLENRAIYAYFATQVEKAVDNWDLQNYYEYSTFDGKNTAQLSNLEVNSQLVFFFEEDASGTFDAAVFTIRHKSGEKVGENTYNAEMIDGATVNKISDQKLVVVTLNTQEAVNYIKSNGFKLRVTNIEGKKVVFKFFGLGKN